jgi:hypothetical protein
VPTVSGGRQVIFSDVEVLTQESPTGGSPRKRSYEGGLPYLYGQSFPNLERPS